MKASENHLSQQTVSKIAFIILLVCVLLTGNSNSYAETHALLVGVSTYVNLDSVWWLDGSENDVILFADLLENRFGINSQQMTVLSGWPEQEENRPTRSRIVAVLDSLSGIIKEDDQVILYFSGHGSRQPANPDPSDIESDGLDEIFLPADASQWNEEIGSVENSIIDDEFGTWINKMQEAGGNVSAIFDVCHSGTMVRAPSETSEKSRWLPEILLIPHMIANGARVLERLEFSESNRSIRTDRLAALYAVQSNESAKERGFPNLEDPVHGWFTYSLASVAAASERDLTYQEWISEVQSFYESQGRTDMTPQIEGGLRDSRIFGVNSNTN